jgi:plastocyanin
MARRGAAQALSPAIALFFVCALVLLAGCSKHTDPPVATTAPAAAPPPASNGSLGTVTGRAPAPAPGGVVVIVLEPRTERTFPPQVEKPVMDQVGQTFGPDFLLVRTGQPVEFRNSDDTLHNVHVTHEETREAAFNVAIPTGESYSYTFARDGFYHVGCDIHSAMAATIFSAPTPFTTLAESDGRFAFTDVPAGAWTVNVYAAGRHLRRDVDVHGGVVEVTLE